MNVILATDPPNDESVPEDLVRAIIREVVVPAMIRDALRELGLPDAAG